MKYKKWLPIILISVALFIMGWFGHGILAPAKIVLQKSEDTRYNFLKDSVKKERAHNKIVHDSLSVVFKKQALIIDSLIIRLYKRNKKTNAQLEEISHLDNDHRKRIRDSIRATIR